MITLEYNGTEKSLSYWGITLDSATCNRRNLATSTYSINIPGASITAAPTFPYRGKIIIRRQREGTDATSYSDGYVAFIGYRIGFNAYTSGAEKGVAYSFANAWHFLQNSQFQQYWASKNTETEAIEYKPVSELVLFTALDESNVQQKLNAGEQIEAVLQFLLDQFAAQSMAQPFIIGTIDPDIPFPSYQAQEMSCEAVILKALEMSPDVQCWFDYSTAVGGVPTPTIHFYSPASLTAKSLAIENGTDHASLNIVPRHDLVPSAVIIKYKVTNSIDGSVFATYYTDKYGPNGQDSDTDPDGGLDVVIQTINLQGYTQNNVYGSLRTEAVTPNAADQADRKTWWAKFHPEFATAKTRAAVFADATIKDRDGNDVSLSTYPNRLLPDSGPLLPWMELSGGGGAINGKWVEIQASVTYEEFDATSGGNKVAKAKSRVVKQTAIVTNGVTGDYSSLGSFIAGETVPGLQSIDAEGNGVFVNGIAKKVYDALSTLQYEGEDVRVQEVISNPAGDGPLIDLCHKLNLTGGAAAWATMNAAVQSITEHDGSGHTSISFGPKPILSIGGFAELFQFNRLRRVFFNPAVAQTADLGTSGSSIQMPDKVPAENSVKGLNQVEYDAAIYQTTV